LIENPKVLPEKFIEGLPNFTCSNLQITLNGKPIKAVLPTGTLVKVRADIQNTGSSGVAQLSLLLDRKPIETKPFPVIKGNVRTIEFEIRLNNPGSQELAIGETIPQKVKVEGEKPKVSFDQLHLSEERILAGESVHITAMAKNLQPTDIQTDIHLFAAGKIIKTEKIILI
jgi:hypothetical protein